jgi:hypothetical protein
LTNYEDVGSLRTMTSDPGPFTPIRPNPYIVGTPIRDRTMFFGREAEFELVRKRFSESGHGGLLVFCGERRSGKTSILFQILDRRLGPDFIPVLIDMQSMAVSHEIDFLDKLSREVLAALGPSGVAIPPPEFREGSNHSATFGQFIERVLAANPQKKLILLFDEYELFENKIASGTLREDVLYLLANLIERQSVYMVFTGSQHLEARRAEYWKILGKSLYKTISYLGLLHSGDLSEPGGSGERPAEQRRLARDPGARGRQSGRESPPPDDLPLGRSRT